ncbi:MAG: hypothetical protein R3F53_17290 [Gammaproteobacteria bacterium]
MSRPTQKQLNGLISIYQEGPALLYEIEHAFRGRICKLYGPENLHINTFRSLARKDWIEKLGEDDFKSLWDISLEGVCILQDYDSTFARIDDRLILKRLNSTAEVYGYDSLGLIARKANPVAISRPN